MVTGVSMTAPRRRNLLYGAALALLIIGTILSLIGLKNIFMPFWIITSLLMWSAAYWDGWINGQREQKDRDNNGAT